MFSTLHSRHLRSSCPRDPLVLQLSIFLHPHLELQTTFWSSIRVRKCVFFRSSYVLTVDDSLERYYNHVTVFYRSSCIRSANDSLEHYYSLSICFFVLSASSLQMAFWNNITVSSLCLMRLVGPNLVANQFIHHLVGSDIINSSSVAVSLFVIKFNLNSQCLIHRQFEGVLENFSRNICRIVSLVSYCL